MVTRDAPGDGDLVEATGSPFGVLVYQYPQPIRDAVRRVLVTRDNRALHRGLIDLAEVSLGWLAGLAMARYRGRSDASPDERVEDLARQAASRPSLGHVFRAFSECLRASKDPLL